MPFNHSYTSDKEDKLNEKVPSNCSTEEDETEVDPEIKVGEKEEYDLSPKNKDEEKEIQVPPENLTFWIRRAVEDYFSANPGPRYVLKVFSQSK